MKRPEKEINGKSDLTKAQETGVDLLQGLNPQILEHPTVLPLSNGSTGEDSRNSSPSPVSKLLEELSLDCSITDYTAVINGKAEDQNYNLLNGKENGEWRGSLSSPSQSSQSSPVKQKPPAVSKKPKISFLPPFSPQPINEQVPSQQDDRVSPSQTEDQVDAMLKKMQEEEIESKSEQQEEDETSDSSEPLTESTETSTATQDESHTSASASQEAGLDNGVCTNGDAHEEEGEDGDGTSSTTGSISSKEDDTGESGFHLPCFLFLQIKV